MFRKKQFLLLLVLCFAASQAYTQTVKLIDKKGTIKEVESSPWLTTGVAIYNKTTGTVVVSNSGLTVPTTINTNAAMQFMATDKGILIPRVELLATNAVSPFNTLSASDNGLMVYNTATIGTTPNNVIPGFYYWETNSWKAIAATSAITIAALNTTSTANGGTLINGELKLSPADATNGGVVTNTAQNIAGEKNFTNAVTFFGSTLGSGLELGSNLEGNGTSFIDFHTSTGLDYNTRFFRESGVNGEFIIKHNGTGAFSIGYENTPGNLTTRFHLKNGFLGLNTTNPNNYNLSIASTGANNRSYNLGFNDFGANVVSTGNLSQTYADDSYYSWKVGESTKMILTASDNLLLGRDVDAGYKLDVSGNARFKGPITLEENSGFNTITYPNTGGSAGQVLTTDGLSPVANATWQNPAVPISFSGNLAGDVTGTQAATVVQKINGVALSGLSTGLLINTTGTGVPSIAVAGTDYVIPSGSITGNAATATTATTATNATITNDVATFTVVYPTWVTANTGNLPLKVSDSKFSFIPSTGSITATGDATINGLTMGKGNFGYPSNTAFGVSALANTLSINNTAVGNSALRANGIGNSNNAFGHEALILNTSGNNNIANGSFALNHNSIGSNNVAIGHFALSENLGDSNTSIGYLSGNTNTIGTQNTLLGANANVGSNNLTNATAIGNGATVSTSNTIQLGNAAVINVNTAGALTTGAVTYPILHGTSGQFLRTDGSVLSWATPSTVATAYSGILPIPNGGTGSATQNFVDLTTNQTIAGTKTFNNAVTNFGSATGGSGLELGTNITQDSHSFIDFHSALPTSTDFDARIIRNSGTNSNLDIFNAGSGGIRLVNNSITALYAQAGNVGIGNLAPAYKLDVTGTGRFTGALTTGAVTYPIVAGTNGQVLTTDGTSLATWQNPATIAAAGTLTGTTLNSTVVNSSLTSVGTLTSLTVTNPIAGSITGNAATVTTNANLTGAITSSGSNVTSLGSFTSANLSTALTDETGTGSAVFSTSPALVTPNIGAATGTSLAVTSQLTSSVATGTAPFVVTSTTPVANLSIGGNAATATTATNATITNDVATTTAVYPTWVTANTGNLPIKVSDSKFSFIPNTGSITATGDATINQLTIGKGGSNLVNNTAVGASVLINNTTGIDNTGLGYNALKFNTTGSKNTSTGAYSLNNNTTGANNTAMGYSALFNITNHNQNTAIGQFSLTNLGYGGIIAANATGNTAIGYLSGKDLFSSINNTFLGHSTSISASTIAAGTVVSNSTAIGNGAMVDASDRIQLGNTNVKKVITSGALTTGAVTYPIVAGTNGQVLTTDGTSLATWQDPATIAAAGTLTGTTLNSTVVNSSLTSVGTLTNLTVTNPIAGSITGNAATVTTNANLTGAITSSGSNVTSLGSFTSANLSTALTDETGTGSAVFSTSPALVTPNIGAATGTSLTVTGQLTSGALTTGTVTYPNTHNSTAGQVLTTNAIGVATWANNTATSPTISNYTTSSTVYPTFVTANTGSLPIYVSSTMLSLNPSTGSITAAGDATISAITVGEGNNKIGWGNVAFGDEALKTSTAGNVAVENTGIGTYALQLNTTGYKNTALGAYSLNNNTIGNNNVAIANNSLNRNTEGNFNVAVGNNSLYNNLIGTNNVAVGRNSLQQNKSSYNTALGDNAGVNNTGVYTGVPNTSTGYNNTFIGNNTGSSNTTGYQNTFIGAEANTNGSSALFNATAIGYNAIATQSNMVRIGNGSVGVIQGQVGFSNSSDIRLKKDITNSKYGLNTILQLRPVDYTLKSNNLKQVGFIAQEVQKLVPEVVTGIEGDLEKGETLGITYGNFSPILTKAIQEQQVQIIGNEDKTAALTIEVADLKTQLKNQQTQIDELKALLEKVLAAQK